MNYRTITNDRQFVSSCGKTRQEFNSLLILFEEQYLLNKGQSYESYISNDVTQNPKFEHLGDALFFVLFQLKNNLLLDTLGVVFEMSTSTASTNFSYFSNLLEQTLEKKK